MYRELKNRLVSSFPFRFLGIKDCFSKSWRADEDIENSSWVAQGTNPAKVLICQAGIDTQNSSAHFSWHLMGVTVRRATPVNLIRTKITHSIYQEKPGYSSKDHL